MKTVLTAHTRIAGGDYESTGLLKPRDLFGYTCGELGREQIRALLDKSSHLIEFYDHVADELLSYWGGDVFVDKVWPRSFRLWFAVRAFPEARWLHIVRDGRDCFCSARHHPNVPQGRSLDTFARYWVTCNRLVERYVQAERCMVIKYEALVADPGNVLPTVMDFLGLEVDAGQYHPAKAGRVPSIRKHAYHSRLVQPLDDRSVGRYRSDMTPQEIHDFWRIAGTWLVKYQYPRDETVIV